MGMKREDHMLSEDTRIIRLQSDRYPMEDSDMQFSIHWTSKSGIAKDQAVALSLAECRELVAYLTPIVQEAGK